MTTVLASRSARTFGAVAMLTTLALTASACGSSDSGGSSDGSSDSQRIGISVPQADTPFWEQFSDTIDSESEALGLDTLAVVNANGDVAKQVNDLQTLVTQGARGIVLSPVDSGAISASLDTLERAGIPVVAVNDPPAAGKVAIVVQADNEGYGRDQCEAMVAAGITSGSVVNIQGDQSNIAGRQRSDGLENCMAEEAPGVRVLQVATEWDAESATNGLQTLLAANSDIRGVAMAAGGAFLPAVLQVLESRGQLVPREDPGHIFLTSIDGVELEYEAISNGFADAVVAQPVADYAKYGLQYVVAAMNGETFSEGPTDHDSEIVMNDNGYLLDQLPATVITIDNLSTVYPG